MLATSYNSYPRAAYTSLLPKKNPQNGSLFCD